MPMSPHPTEARWGVCACNVAAITSEYGIARPVLDAREKWKKPEIKSFGHEIYCFFFNNNTPAMAINTLAMNTFISGKMITGVFVISMLPGCSKQ